MYGRTKDLPQDANNSLGIAVVSIVSGIRRAFGLGEVMSTAPGLRNGYLAIIVAIFLVQLTAVETARAGDAIQAAENRVGQAAAGDRRSAMSGPAVNHTKELVDTPIADEVHCLALNIYFEARSEPASGQRAVGHVVMNRVAHPGYPDSVCRVVRQGGEKVLHRCQFSWWCDGQSDRPSNRKAWDQSLRLAEQIYLGVLKDTTGGALWYHASYVKPYWSDVLRKGDRIGQHIFYLENRRSEETL